MAELKGIMMTGLSTIFDFQELSSWKSVLNWGLTLQRDAFACSLTRACQTGFIGNKGIPVPDY